MLTDRKDRKERLTDADPRSLYTEEELAQMREAILARSRPDTRRQRILREAIAADVEDFGAFAMKMNLPTWLQACRARTLAEDARRGRPQRTQEQWLVLEGQFTASYADNCTFYSRQPPAVFPARSDAGRLYTEENDR